MHYHRIPAYLTLSFQIIWFANPIRKQTLCAHTEKQEEHAFVFMFFFIYINSFVTFILDRTAVNPDLFFINYV